MHLGFKSEELKEYEENSKKLRWRLFNLLADWKKKVKHPIVETLISAFEKAGVGGEARRVLNL